MQCAHNPCTCSVTPGESFCSEECATDTDEMTCACGHAECEATLPPVVPPKG
jgi:hypothetical protein